MDIFEKKSKLILDNISAQIYIIDKHYNIMDCNSAFSLHVKQSRENIIGQACYKMAHKCDMPCWQLNNIVCPAMVAFEKNKKYRAIHKHFINDKVVVEEVISTPIIDAQYVLEEYRDLSDLLGLDQGILPICAGCKKIRDDHGNWYQIERYIHDKTGADFSHSICPDCAKHLYPELKGQGKKK